jgi:aldehyde dehydrogenase (NAD+)
VAAISFTGSVATGRGIAAKAIARMAKLQLEMGGKNPLVVLDDADLPTAVNCAVQGAYYSTGQRCTASSRLIVTAGIHDRFVAALTDKVKSLKVDDALAPGTDIGPVVDQSQLDQDLSYLEIGRKEGAKVAFGGERLKREHEGYYLAPALFTEASNAMRISREEIFGPVASVIRARDYDEALALANDTEFGLSAGIVTTSLKHASHFKRHAQAGMVMVNLPTAGVDYHVPFGGRKGSSYGPREQGRYAAEFFTVVKTAYTAP